MELAELQKRHSVVVWIYSRLVQIYMETVDDAAARAKHESECDAPP